MRRIGCVLFLLILLGPTHYLHAQASVTFRVLCGVTDTTATRWDGSLKVTNAGPYTLEGWRFENDDSTTGDHFHFSTRPARTFGQPAPKTVVANGLFIIAG